MPSCEIREDEIEKFADKTRKFDGYKTVYPSMEERTTILTNH